MAKFDKDPLTYCERKTAIYKTKDLKVKCNNILIKRFNYNVPETSKAINQSIKTIIDTLKLPKNDIWTEYIALSEFLKYIKLNKKYLKEQPNE